MSLSMGQSISLPSLLWCGRRFIISICSHSFISKTSSSITSLICLTPSSATSDSTRGKLAQIRKTGLYKRLSITIEQTIIRTMTKIGHIGWSYHKVTVSQTSHMEYEPGRNVDVIFFCT